MVTRERPRSAPKFLPQIVTQTPLLFLPPVLGPLSRSEKKMRGGAGKGACAESRGETVASNRRKNKEDFMNLLFNHFADFFCAFYQRSSVSLLSSSNSTGHSGQLCLQHTIRWHLSVVCPCLRKFLLSYSNSMNTRCHRPGSISRNASASGNSVCNFKIANPSLRATAPKRRITSCSFEGASTSGDFTFGGP